MPDHDVESSLRSTHPQQQPFRRGTPCRLGETTVSNNSFKQQFRRGATCKCRWPVCFIQRALSSGQDLVFPHTCKGTKHRAASMESSWAPSRGLSKNLPASCNKETRFPETDVKGSHSEDHSTLQRESREVTEKSCFCQARPGSQHLSLAKNCLLDTKPEV